MKLKGKSDKYLLRHFCCGCWDQSLTGLQLEHRKKTPPTFPELLLLIRRVEDRSIAKVDWMRLNLGSAKAAVQIHSALNMPGVEEEPAAVTTKRQDVNPNLEKEARGTMNSQR